MPKRILQGTVVSDKTDKTVVVRVERRLTDPVMKKTFENRRSTTFMMLKINSRPGIRFASESVVRSQS